MILTLHTFPVVDLDLSGRARAPETSDTAQWVQANLLWLGPLLAAAAAFLCCCGCSARFRWGVLRIAHGTIFVAGALVLGVALVCSILCGFIRQDRTPPSPSSASQAADAEARPAGNSGPQI